MIKFQWLDKGQTVNEPCLVFGWDTPDDIFGEVNVTTKYLHSASGGKRFMEHFYNLCITGFGQIAPSEFVVPKAEVVGDGDDGTLRDVYPIVNDPLLPFRAGLTVHRARGTWSSLPHKFEREEILTPRPSPFYEKFAYMTDPPGGWGVQVRIGHLYREHLVISSGPKVADYDMSVEMVNDIVPIRDGDMLDIPLGSHPVSGGAGIKMAYWWVYWGDNMGSREKY